MRVCEREREGEREKSRVERRRGGGGDVIKTIITIIREADLLKPPSLNQLGNCVCVCGGYT